MLLGSAQWLKSYRAHEAGPTSVSVVAGEQLDVWLGVQTNAARLQERACHCAAGLCSFHCLRAFMNERQTKGATRVDSRRSHLELRMNMKKLSKHIT